MRADDVLGEAAGEGEGSEGLESIHKKAKSGSTSTKAPSVASGEDD